jgi:hypothetical protein
MQAIETKNITLMIDDAARNVGYEVGIVDKEVNVA